jgi:hypothetical protein
MDEENQKQETQKPGEDLSETELADWAAAKARDLNSYEKGSRASYKQYGEMAGWHRFMNSRRAREVREATLEEYIASEISKGITDPNMDIEKETE